MMNENSSGPCMGISQFLNILFKIVVVVGIWMIVLGLVIMTDQIAYTVAEKISQDVMEKIEEDGVRVVLNDTTIYCTDKNITIIRVEGSKR